MIDPYILNQIKQFIESGSEVNMQQVMIDLQGVVYALGGSRDISTMTPGATALYLTILLELNRS